MADTKAKNYEIDMTHGPLLGKLMQFSLPLILSSILEVMFNAADTMVLGQLAGTKALAAVGSVGSVPQLLISVLMGISIGVNVMAARHVAAGEKEELQRVIDTSFLLCLYISLGLMVVGIIFARPMLRLLGSPDDIIDLSQTYLVIYYLGLPGLGIYNMGAAVLRSVGDTRRPMYYLAFSGALNVALNLFFVVVFHMTVAGVAIGTVVSESVSAILVMRCIAEKEESLSFSLKGLHMNAATAGKVLRIGLPAAIESSLFSIGNLTIQSSINSLGPTVMASATATRNIDSFVYIGMHAMNQSCLTFVSQNYGAGDKSRVNRVTAMSIGLVVLIGGVMGTIAYVFSDPLMAIFTTDEEAIRIGKTIIFFSVFPDWIFGIEDVLCGAIRGLGFSTITMAVSVIGVCGIRVGWVFTMFPKNPTVPGLYSCYPISWTVTAAFLLICFFVCRNRAFRREEAQEKRAA